jgi:hypothetical protein
VGGEVEQPRSDYGLSIEAVRRSSDDLRRYLAADLEAADFWVAARRILPDPIIRFVVLLPPSLATTAVIRPPLVTKAS